jgi:hypothetical protein
MRQIPFVVALTAAFMLWHGSPAHAQLQPIGAELCSLAGIGCPGPVGPQGPQGPAGPAGSFDANALYSKTCVGTVTCACDQGDFAVGGGGACLEASHHLNDSFPIPADGQPTSWSAACADAAGNFVGVNSSHVVCVRQ